MYVAGELWTPQYWYLQTHVKIKENKIEFFRLSQRVQILASLYTFLPPNSLICSSVTIICNTRESLDARKGQDFFYSA